VKELERARDRDRESGGGEEKQRENEKKREGGGKRENERGADLVFALPFDDGSALGAEVAVQNRWPVSWRVTYGVASVSRIEKIIGLLSKRAL